jgi:hypothetical protein
MSRPDFETTVETTETSGIAVSCRKSEQPDRQIISR